jgi:hypothetical protein
MKRGNIYNVIPVELSSFYAEVSGNEVLLKWTTATETNNSGFEIQRCPSLIPSRREGTFHPPLWGDWGAIGFVPGFGTTTETKFYSFIDEDINSGTYKFRLKQINFDGTFEYSDEIVVDINLNPNEFMLYQNYPNPFNPNTTINYQLPVDSKVILKVFDVLGNEVATLVNEEKPAGEYEVTFDSHSSLSGISGLPSGIYFYQLQAVDHSLIKKMMLIK